MSSIYMEIDTRFLANIAFILFLEAPLGELGVAWLHHILLILGLNIPYTVNTNF